MIQEFLSTPEPNCPQEPVFGNQYLKERQMFNRTAKYWTYIYAIDEENRQTINRKEFKVFDEMVRNLMIAKNMTRDQ
jgi:ubiquitin-conjugating enzyme (huntingtin interacting protein 2)